MAQDLTIDIGINTISAIASLQNLGTIADRVFEKKHKLSFDDSSIKEFSNNLQNEFAKAVKSLDFSPVFAASQAAADTLTKTLEQATVKIEQLAASSEKKESGGMLGGMVDSVKNFVSSTHIEKAIQIMVMLGDAGLEASKKNFALEIAFRSAGIAGDELTKQLDATNKMSRELGFSLAAPPERLRELAGQAALLGGATGKTNDDLVKLGIGIEKATNGAVSGEQAIDIFTKGLSNPANADAINTLTARFPQLQGILSSTGDVSVKAAEGIKVMDSTFTALSVNAGNTEGVLSNVLNVTNEVFSSLGGGIIDGLSKGLDSLSSLGDSSGLASFFSLLDSVGKELGETWGKSFAFIVDVINSIKEPLEVIVNLIMGSLVVAWVVLQKQIESAREIILNALNGVIEVFSPLTDAFQSLFGSLESGSDSFASFSEILEEYYNVLEEVADFIVSVLIGAFELMWDPIVQISTLVVQLVEYLFSLVSSSNSASSALDTFKNILKNVSVFIAGMTGAFKGAIQGIKDLASAIFSLDFGKIKDAFFNIGKATVDGAAKGITDKKKEQISEAMVKTLEASLGEIDKKLVINPKVKVKTLLNYTDEIEKLQNKIEASFKSGKIDQDQKDALIAKTQEQLRIQEEINAQIAKGNAEQNKGKPQPKPKTDELALAREKFAIEKDLNKIAFKNFENAKLEKAAAEGRSLSDEENLEIKKKALELQANELEKYKEIFKIKEENGEVKEIGLSISGEARRNIILDFAEMRNDLLKESIDIKNITVGDGVSKQLDSIINQFDNRKLEINLEASNSAEVNTTIEEAEKKIQNLNAFINKTQTQINDSTDNSQKAILNEAVNQATDAVNATEQKITKLRADVRNAEFDKRLLLMDDEAEAELLKQQEALRKKMEKDLASFDLTEDEKILIKTRAQIKLSELEEEYRKKNELGFIAGLKQAADIAFRTIADVFTRPVDISELFNKEDFSDQIADLNKEQDTLFDQLKEGTISYEEYQSAVAEVQKQIDELNAKQKDVDLWGFVWDNFKTNAVIAFEEIGNKMTDLRQKFLDQRSGFLADEEKYNNEINKILENGGKVSEELTEQRNNATEKANDAMNASYAALGAGVVASMAKMTAEGIPFLHAMVYAAIDGVQAMIPVWSAQILGWLLGTPQSAITGGGWALAAWASLTAILTAAVNAAKGGIASLLTGGKGYGGKKFKDGGEITKNDGMFINGEQFVVVNETGESEFVVNAKAYRKNKALLQHLNSGGTYESYMAGKALSGISVTPEGKLTDNTTLHNKVYEIQQILPRLQHQTNHAINTMFEIQRRSDKELINTMNGVRKDIRKLAHNYESHSYGHLDLTLDKGVILKKIETDIQIQRVR